GRWLELGATTTWEKWDTGGSHNHPMFGGGMVWLYRKLAGMQADPNQPGYRHIIFKPQPVDEINFAKYYNETPYGNAGIHWQRTDGKMNMLVSVPVGCTAKVYLPCDDVSKVKESGLTLSENDEISLIFNSKESPVLEIGSGNYKFYIEK
ncbi:MAG: alpha-L-rhamnosidase C-terminal domain-containing protein, partial [Draconibacterium sp.]|nr:alpha-L-rhamnosidase C-terminal domain-containing protein [Draconibacterium sp.]